MPSSPCNYKYASKCYRDLQDAEIMMRSVHKSRELLTYDYETATHIYYKQPTQPALPTVKWRGQYIMSTPWHVWGPYFATEQEAEAWMVARAGTVSKRYPDKVVSNNLVLRGEFDWSGTLRERVFSHNFTAVPIGSIAPSDTTYYRYCSQYTPGIETAKVTRDFHFVYATDANIPSTQVPNIAAAHFNNCYVNDVWYRIQGLYALSLREEANSILCNSGYTYTGGECVGTVTDSIEKQPGYVLEAPVEPPSCEDKRDNIGAKDESNPCSPVDGTKTQVELDYASPAEGGLVFSRYYTSKGAYKSASEHILNWRHTYNRSIDTAPDVTPTFPFEPPERSSQYTTAADACTLGWNDIKATVYGGSLSTGTAVHAGGNICEIQIAGVTKAYFTIRSTTTWIGYLSPGLVKTVIRPNGTARRFVQVGADWVDKLNPAVRLEVSGSDWIYVDANDVEETYNSSGQLISITKRNGQTETLTYTLTAAQGGDDDSTTLDRVVGPFGHEITFTYADGRLSSVTTPDGTISYDVDNDRRLTSVTYPDSTTKTYLYEESHMPGGLTGIVDENGDRYATWDYDAEGRAILSEHAGKDKVEFVFNTNGTTTLTNGLGASRTYTFTTEQGRQRLSGITGDRCSSCPGGDAKDLDYDANGFVNEITDWLGTVTKFTRNGRGLVTTLTEGFGSTEQRATTYVWHADYDLPTKITTPINVTDIVHDTSGNPTSVTITDGTDTRAWTMTYNSNGQPLTVNGPRTDVTDTTTYEYYTCTTGDECGQLKKITNALGHVTDFNTYDASGRLTKMTDPNGLETSYTYDSRGRVLTVTQTPTTGTARTTTMTYDDAGQLETLTTPDSAQLTFAYDAAHYLESVTDNFSNVITYTYDAMGNLTDQDTRDDTATLKRAIDYAYELNSELDSITHGGHLTDITVDLGGNVTNVTDPKLASTVSAFDALNRLESVTDAASGLTEYAYDDHDRVTSVDAPNGATTTYEYDDFDNLTKEISPDRGTITYTHDDAGNVETMTDARGKVTTYSYDALNRITLETLDDLSTIAYEYDVGSNAKGRLNKITDPSGNTAWSYNNFGDITSKTQTIGTVALTTDYDYDTTGRLDKITLPSGKEVTYGYDTNLATSVTVDSTTILSSATYDPFGSVTGWTWGNSSTSSRVFDVRGLMTSVSIAGATRTLGYDSTALMTSLTDSRHTDTFDYDSLYRLDDFDHIGSAPLPATQDFTYDANGNRSSINENGSPYAYSNLANSNRLLSTAGPTAKTYTYDAAGNVTNDNTHTYAYDDRGRLIDMDSGSATYEHNGQGQRVEKDNGTVTLFAYDEGGRLIGEYTSAGLAVQEHVWFAGAPVAVLAGTAKHYVHTDHLGTPRAITDGSTVIWRWESDPFGSTAAQEDPDGDTTDFTYNLRFAGQYFDSESALHYNYFRTYDPATGKYLQSDPIGIDGGLSTYGYVTANPMSYTDSLGLFVDSVTAACAKDPVFCADINGGFSEFVEEVQCTIDGMESGLLKTAAGVAVGAAATAYALSKLRRGKNPFAARSRKPSSVPNRAALEKAQDSLGDSLTRIAGRPKSRQPAVAVGGTSTSTGRTAAGQSVSGCGGKRCAELDVAAQVGGNPRDIVFTKPVRPRTGETVPVCKDCQGVFSRDQFPPGTPFE